MSKQEKTLMVMAGGTGGHVYPAMAVADYLKNLGWNIVWLCTEGGMENRLIENKGYQKAMISMRGVRGNGLLGWLMLPMRLVKASSQAGKAIKLFKPNVVLGMGGFAAFPGGMQAWLLNKPIVIHEQNSIPGLTNRVLALFATRILAAFPSAFDKKAQLVGNPVREDITHVEVPENRMKTRNGPLRIFVVGGSLGAQVFNEVIPKALAEISIENRPQVTHQAGEKHITVLQANYRAVGVNADAKAFVQDMAAMYAWADIVVCRAGALTIAELCAAGVASVLVPFPFAVDDHQTLNARYLSDANAAMLISQTEFTVQKVVSLFNGLSRKNCLDMAIRARRLGKPEATSNVAKICMEIAA